jgi:hypothetical protein
MAQFDVVGLGRFELPTSRLSGVRSNQLSYRPVLNAAWRRCSLPPSTLPQQLRLSENRQAGALKTEQERRRINVTAIPFRPRTLPSRPRFDPRRRMLLRKEVIQPQVLLQLPCYDFTPITDHTLGGCPPCGLAHRLLVQPTFVM